jgi:hypothetical protein
MKYFMIQKLKNDRTFCIITRHSILLNNQILKHYHTTKKKEFSTTITKYKITGNYQFFPVGGNGVSKTYCPYFTGIFARHIGFLAENKNCHQEIIAA